MSGAVLVVGAAGVKRFVFLSSIHPGLSDLPIHAARAARACLESARRQPLGLPLASGRGRSADRGGGADRGTDAMIPVTTLRTGKCCRIPEALSSPVFHSRKDIPA